MGDNVKRKILFAIACLFLLIAKLMAVKCAFWMLNYGHVYSDTQQKLGMLGYGTFVGGMILLSYLNDRRRFRGWNETHKEA